MSEKAKWLSENSYIKLGWALTILGSCVFAAFRVGCVCAQIERHETTLAKHDSSIQDHDRRLAAGETWARIHEIRDARTRTP